MEETVAHQRAQPQIAMLSQARTAAPDAGDVLALTTLINQRRFSELAARAGLLARRHPDNALGWRMLGLAQAELKNHAGAAATWLRLSTLCPLDADNWNALGLAVGALGRLAEAETVFRQALAVAPDHALAQCNLGSVLQRRGNLTAARAAPAAQPGAESGVSRCLSQYGRSGG